MSRYPIAFGYHYCGYALDRRVKLKPARTSRSFIFLLTLLLSFWLAGCNESTSTLDSLFSGSSPNQDGVITYVGTTVTASTHSVEADGISAATITVKLVDPNGNPISNKAISLASDQIDTINPDSANSNGSGVATFTVKSTGIHTSTFTATDITDSIVFNRGSGIQQPQIEFIDLAPVLSNSTLTIPSTTLYKNETTTVTLTLMNSKNAPIKTSKVAAGSITLSATSGTGTSLGSFGTVVNQGNGVFTSVFTASRKGTATSALAVIPPYSGAVTSSQSLTVANSAPVATLMNNASFPLTSSTPLVQGTSYTLATATDGDGDAVTWNCTYQTLGLGAGDPNYSASGTSCTSLASIVTGANNTLYVGTVSTSSSTLTWTPTNTQRGTYVFTLQPTDSYTPGATSTLYVTVRDNDSTSNLLYGVDALFATNETGLSSSSGAGSFTSGTSAGGTNWLNFLNGSLSSPSATAVWSGLGSAGNPYTLQLDGTSSNMDLGLSLSTDSNHAKFALETWVQPTTVATPSAGTVILSNGGGTGNGMVLRQSTTPLARAEFVVGSRIYSYKNIVLTDSPAYYWRLDDTNGSAADTQLANTGTYSGTYSQSQTGAISGDSDTAARFDGASGYIYTTTSLTGPQTFSLETWFKTTLNGYSQGGLLIGFGDTSTTNANSFDRAIFMNTAGKLIFSIYNSGAYNSVSTTAYNDGNWHHVVGTFSASSLLLYVDGALQTTNTGSTAAQVYNGYWHLGGINCTNCIKYEDVQNFGRIQRRADIV